MTFTWKNDGNGNFSDGKGNTVIEKEPDNNSRSPDWASKGPFKVHQRANKEGIFRNKTPDYTGDLGKALKALDEGTEYADSDQFQTGAYSYRHGMRNSDETKAQAMSKADAFVRAQFMKAKQLLADGKTHDAYFEFAIGLHALQDATSPAHGGFQMWSGNESLAEEIKHVKQEIFYPGTNSNLQKVTNYYLNWFQNGGQLPKGNLFQSISHD